MVSPKDLQKEIMEDYKEIEAIFTGESAKLIFKNQYENFYNVLMKNWDKETTMAKKSKEDNQEILMTLSRIRTLK